jgi:ligand-binding sensor domain-containing protein
MFKSTSRRLKPDTSILPTLVSLLFLLNACSTPEGTKPPPEKEVWQVFKQSQGTLVNNHINAIFLDNSRRIWFATNNGVSYFAGGNWATIRDSLSSPGPGGLSYRVSCITQGKDRSMWFGLTGGGIQRYNPNSSIAVWKRFTDPDLISDVILSGTADVSNQTTFGEVWFTSAQGIMQFVGAINETGTWHIFTHTSTPAIPSNQVWSSENALQDNSIWFGAQTGGAAYSYYNLAGSLSWGSLPLPFDSKINSIAFDLHNIVWFGTENGAVAFNSQSSAFTRFDTASAGPGLRDEPVNAVTTDHQTTRWFGTEGGLVRLSDTAWTRFTAANSPLPSDTVTALAYDFNQNIWIGTINGVAVYNAAGVTF